MSYTDCRSLGSASSFSTDCISLPKSRIRCSKNQIVVGGNSFRSASDALSVYLKQYDAITGQDGRGRGQGYDPRWDSVNSSQNMSVQSLPVVDHSVDRIDLNGTQDVEQLLLSQISSSQLRESVIDTLREVKMQSLLKHAALKSQTVAKTDLQCEVEAALLRSAQLLEKVAKDDNSFTSILTSDIDSAPAKILGNELLASLDLSEIGKRSSGHVYSYRTSRPQKYAHRHSFSKLFHNPASHPAQQQSKELRRCASTENLMPSSHRLPPRAKRPFGSNSASPSYLSDPTDILRRVRSRSESPGVRLTKNSSSVPVLVGQLDQSVGKSVPSWVGELSPSEVSDSLWNSKSTLEVRNDEKSYQLPNWVGEVEQGTFGEDLNSFHDPDSSRRLLSHGKLVDNDNYNSVRTNDLDSHSAVTTDSRPGLNFSDLASNPGSDKQATFSNIVRKNEKFAVEKFKPKHSSTNQHNHIVAGSQILTHPQTSRMVDSEYNSEAFLHKNVLPQTARLKKSLDNYVASSENLRRKSLTSDVSVSSNAPDCSSIDTMSLLTGKPLLRTDVLAASSVRRDNPIGRSSSSTSSSPNHNSSDGLDGDRPWEQMVSTFKPPVPVDCEDSPDKNGRSAQKDFERTLSGRKQPGSMETLKNMLFKLQAEESSTQEGSNNDENTSSPDPQNHSQLYEDILPALHDYDFQKEPGGQSLEKALVHLNRLKQLVLSTTATSNDEIIVTELPDGNVDPKIC